MKLKKLEMQAFKSYVSKEDGTFDFDVEGVPANFVSIYAPNGFGKTTFYDAIDYCLTNTIHRYVREKSIEKMNESQARSMNKPGTKQHILRSKNAPSDLESRVTLHTSKRIFDRTIPNSRNNGKDFKFSDKDTIDEYRYFRDVMLSQEAIDAFLRENTPEQRYEKFIENQLDGSVEHERDRKQIAASLETVKQNVKALEEQKELNKKKLNTIAAYDISISELEESRSKVSQNFEGVPHFPEEITSYDRNFLNKIEIFVEIRKSELLKLNEQIQEKKQKTTYFLSTFDKFVSNHMLYQRLARSETSLKKQKQELEKLPALELERSSSRAQISNITSQIQSLNTFKVKLPEYLENKIEKNALQVKKCSVEDEKNGEINKLELLNKELVVLQSKKEDLLGKKDAINTAAKNSVKVYEELNELTRTNLKAKDEVSLKESSIMKKELDIKKIKSDLDVFSGETVEVIKNPRIYSMIEDQELAESYEIILVKYQNCFQEYESLKVRSSSLKQYKSVFGNFIEMGLNIIDKELSDVCPLCSKEYKDHETLKSKILKSNHLMEIEKEIFISLENLQSELAILEDKLGFIFSSIRKRMQEKLKFFHSDNENAKKIIIELYKKIEDNETRIAKLRDFVFKKEESAFRSYCSSSVSLYSAELKEIDQREQQVISYLKKSNDLISDLESKALEIDINLQKLSSAESTAFYSFLASNNWDGIDNLKELESKLEELELHSISDLRQIEAQLESISNKIIDIRSKVPIDKEIGNKDAFELVSSKYLDVLHEKEAVANTISSFLSFAFNLNLEKLLSEGAYKILEQEVEKTLSKYTEDYNKNSNLDMLLTELSIQVNHGVKKSEALVITEENRVIEKKLAQYLDIKQCLESDLNLVSNYIKSSLDNYFQTDLINQIYSKIDPHPDFKKIRFDCEIKEKGKPKLNVYITNEDGEDLAPNISFSSAQVNVLSLSIFLARALNTTDESGSNVECILIDDPVQSMDAINVLGVIDLLRNLSFNFDKQIIVSTHDDNFHELLMQKIPTSIYRSKFFELESFGKVSQKVKS